MVIELRRARPDDAACFQLMEQATSELMLAHVFPPENFPYPSNQVRARWELVLADMAHSCLIAIVDGTPAGYVAWADDLIQHLGVDPKFHRLGVATRLLSTAEQSIFTTAEDAYVWVLVENKTAIEFYRRNSWRTTARRRRAEFHPFPIEAQMSKTQSPGSFSAPQDVAERSPDRAGG